MIYDKNLVNKKFEFLLLINGNIICQRYFNVKDYNPNVVNSYDLKECADRCADLITGEGSSDLPSKSTLKGKTWDYLWNSYNPYLDEYPPCDTKNIYDDEDLFTFQIRVNGHSIIEKIFTGNHYPPKVRYDVDIRSVISEIINDVQETMCEKDLTIVNGK